MMHTQFTSAEALAISVCTALRPVVQEQRRVSDLVRPLPEEQVCVYSQELIGLLQRSIHIVRLVRQQILIEADYDSCDNALGELKYLQDLQNPKQALMQALSSLDSACVSVRAVRELRCGFEVLRELDAKALSLNTIFMGLSTESDVLSLLRPSQPARTGRGDSSSFRNSRGFSYNFSNNCFFKEPKPDFASSDAPRPHSPSSARRSSASGDFFSDEHSAARQECEPDSLRRYGSMELHRIFDRCDANHDGKVNKREFIKALRTEPDVADFFHLPQTIRQEDGTRDEMERAFQKLDKNDDREISEAEFMDEFRGRRAELLSNKTADMQFAGR